MSKENTKDLLRMIATPVDVDCERVLHIRKQVKYALTELDKSEWRAVEEPPNSNETIWVIEKGEIKKGYCIGKDFHVWAGESWCPSEDVTHWTPKSKLLKMPIPELPKEIK